MSMSVPYHIPVSAAQKCLVVVGRDLLCGTVLSSITATARVCPPVSTAMPVLCFVLMTLSENPLLQCSSQIHALIMSLKYTGIEIRTAHALDSWNGGVLVMVSGYVQVKGFDNKRKFVEDIFSCPSGERLFCS
ncbi:hypothetical protein NC653_024753 [Populus alba x Populus x berolinensis]|uniref:Nuclear transport factor 2 domain-containing protein n=1 Tax=Populus alba x Populus x berolinensis TaxID=444605 RepID=A0AAD6Q769_9ROSI|nr:hypothetical protein NC653_024753 [Populus alba x Populus x berolinensis]